MTEDDRSMKDLCYDIATIQARKSMMSSWLEETGRMLGRIQSMKGVAKHRADEMGRVYDAARSVEQVFNHFRDEILDAEGAYSKLLDELLTEADELGGDEDDKQA